MSKPSINNFGDLLSALTTEIPYQQQLFNYEFLDRYEAFLPVIEQAQLLGLEALAQAVFPKPNILTEARLDVGFRVMQSSEQQTQLRVQPLNLGFTRRYAYSGHVQNRVQVLVKKIAAEPGKIIQEAPTTQEGKDENG